jgi:molecular chaperone GrpE
VSEKPDTTPEVDGDSTDLDALRQAVEESKKKAAEYFDQLLRLRAEFENFRKRADREKSDARAWGKQEVLMPLVGLIDVFEQALSQTQKAKDLKHVVQGLEMLHKTFTQFIKTEGLEPIETVGKPFDPLTSEAMAQQEVDEEQSGQVLEELQKGYRFQGKVLRPSRVRVGVAKKQEKPESPEPEKTPTEDDL